MSLRRATFSLLSALAVMATASSARADFSLFVVYGDVGAGEFFRIDDDQAGDLDPLAGAINVDTTTLNADLTGEGIDLNFTSLGATSDAPSDGATAFLRQTGIVAGSGTLRVIAIANDYFLNGPSLSLLSEATSIFGSAPGSSEFTSYFDESNTAPGLPITGTPTDVLTFAGQGPFSDAVADTFGLNGSFGLANETLFTLSGGSLQFSGNTEVTAVPEPASMAMLAVGGLGLLAARRRKAQA